MVINPNIILSGNQMAQPRLPDVNAMMQTRTAGLENIYKIEQQRAEQAKAAQKEQEAAQEAATLKALLPAYTYGIQTGDIIGAGNLVPPEMRPQVQQYIDALSGKSPEEVQAALIGSLSSSQAGQEALAAIQRAAAVDVQRGQLDVSKQRLALDKSQAGMPKPMSEYEAESIGIRKREVQLQEEEAAREAAMPEGMDPKVKLKLDQAYPQASRALQSSVTSLDQDIQDVERLLSDDVGLKAITGYLGAYTPNVFSDATRAQALLDKIMSGAGFSALQAMRDASPTGGALGNVSNQEGAKLEKSVAAFSQAQEYGDFKKALRQYLVDLKTAQENVQAAFDETYSYRGEAPSSDIVTQTRERRQRIEEETMPQGRTSLPPGVTVKRN